MIISTIPPLLFDYANDHKGSQIYINNSSRSLLEKYQIYFYAVVN